MLEKTICKYCKKPQILWVRHNDCQDKKGKAIERIFFPEDVLKEKIIKKKVLVDD